MSERIIEQADLRGIENCLRSVDSSLNVLDDKVTTVDSNVRVVYDEVGKLSQEFHDFVDVQIKANRLSVAHTEIIKIRQELDKKYGHYDQIRRTTTGILQANDLAIVKKSTITNATEEMMLNAPGYWLAPCLVALAAWINDQPELAERAVKEGLKRDDEKTSLFFGLVCRRADRKQSSLKWIQRYLASQDEENLDRKTIIILDAYASGVLGADTEGTVSRQMGEWLENLSEKPGFVEKQTTQWTDAINLKKKPLKDTSYTYLKQYSHTWPEMEGELECAHLHQTMLDYLSGIFDQKPSTNTIKMQLDEILDSLVTDFDDEELPLRKKEKLEQLVIDFDGDEKRAKQNMAIEQSAYEIHKDFTQLLTDAAMKPESSHSSISTQKFALALSKDWLSNAYSDITASYRMKIPNDVEVNVDTFNDRTQDGQNENQLLSNFNNLVNQEKDAALSANVLSGFEQFCFYGGIAVGVLGLLMCLIGHILPGIIAVIAGVGMVIRNISAKKNIEVVRRNIESSFEEKRNKGMQIIRALLAEVVDYREEFARLDSQSQEVMDYLERISADQYVHKMEESGRRVKIGK